MPQAETPEPVWAALVARHGVGDVVEGRVTKVVPFGALIDVAGVPGLVVGPAGAEPGQPVPVRIMAMDADRRRLKLAAA